MKSAFLAATVFLTSVAVCIPFYAQARNANYYLCSKFPLNSRCEGYEFPISLEERTGDGGDCELVVGSTTQEGDCKFNISEKGVSIYVEEGSRLSVIGNERATREISIPFEAISFYDYFEYERENSSASAGFGGGLIGGIIAGLTYREKEMSEIEIRYIDESSSHEEQIGFLSIMTARVPGIALKTQLEQLEDSFLGRTLESWSFSTEPTVAAFQNLNHLLATNECEKCDLRGTNLDQANLREAELERANFEGAHLRGVNLDRADLEGVNLRGADLEEAQLREVDLSAKPRRPANLQFANFENANLEGAKLKGALLRGANLAGANLVEADLGVDKPSHWEWIYTFRSDLSHANLTEANLREADLEEALLIDANLNRADLSKSNLEEANLEGADLRGANLNGADLEEAVLVGADLGGADLTSARLEDADMRGANLLGVTLNNTDLEDSNLCNVVLPDGSRSLQGCG